MLLEALQQLPADVRLWVASNGPDTARLQATYAGDPRVEWLGRITEAEKAARLQGASVFCAPALGGESFGVVLLEAMAAGTAVVASDIPGYRNVAAPGRDAVMVPPDDPSALAAALRRILTDDDLAELRPQCRHGAGRVVLDGPPGGAVPRALRAGPDRGRHHAGVPSRGPAGP